MMLYEWWLLLALSSLIFHREILMFEPFNQNDYIIISERIEVMEYVEEYAVARTVNFKFNRTHTASNWTVSYKQDFGYDLRIAVQAYKFASNEYRLFPIVFSVNVCECFKNNDFGIQNMYRCGHIPPCPTVKGNYYVCNWGPDYEKFPPHVPVGRYKIDLTFVYKAMEIIKAAWYMEVKSTKFLYFN